MITRDYISRFRAFLKSDRGKRWAKVAQALMLVAIVGLLAYQILQLGVRDILQSTPTHPLFYLFLLLAYFLLPVCESFIYRLSLDFPLRKGLEVFIKKKILNMDVYPYSGEAYFYLWARKNLKESPKHIFHIVKDNNIISSFSSTFIAVLLLACFMYFGDGTRILETLKINQKAFLAIIAGLVLVVVLAIYFRKQIIGVSLNTGLKIFGLHSLRFVGVYALELFQWMVVMPEVPLSHWLIFLANKIIITRVPFVNHDLLYIATSIELAKHSSVSEAQIAALMLVASLFNKAISILFFIVVASKDKMVKKAQATPPPGDSAA